MRNEQHYSFYQIHVLTFLMFDRKPERFSTFPGAFKNLNCKIKMKFIYIYPTAWFLLEKGYLNNNLVIYNHNQSPKS